MDILERLRRVTLPATAIYLIYLALHTLVNVQFFVLKGIEVLPPMHTFIAMGITTPIMCLCFRRYYRAQDKQGRQRLQLCIFISTVITASGADGLQYNVYEILRQPMVVKTVDEMKAIEHYDGFVIADFKVDKAAALVNTTVEVPVDERARGFFIRVEIAAPITKPDDRYAVWILHDFSKRIYRDTSEAPMAALKKEVMRDAQMEFINKDFDSASHHFDRVGSDLEPFIMAKYGVPLHQLTILGPPQHRLQREAYVSQFFWIAAGLLLYYLLHFTLYRVY
jgi:hypothetical protein